MCQLNQLILHMKMEFPPHCTHRMQPLDVGVFGPFKAYLKTAFKDFTTANPITIYDVGKLSCNAFYKAFTPTNITLAFAKTGFFPLNRLIFDEDDFAAAYATDRPLSDGEQSTVRTDRLLPDGDQNEVPIEIILDENIIVPEEKTLSTSTLVSLECVRPYPKAGDARKKTNRFRVKMTIYMLTPIKENIR